MVDCELSLEPVDGTGLVNGHQPGIVDQQVQVVMLAPEVGRRDLDRGKVSQVQLQGFHIGGRDRSRDRGDGRLSLADVAAGQDDGGIGNCKCQRDLVAQA